MAERYIIARASMSGIVIDGNAAPAYDVGAYDEESGVYRPVKSSLTLEQAKAYIAERYAEQRENTDALYSRARDAFDTITGASWFGFGFRAILMHDHEALEAAERLAAKVKSLVPTVTSCGEEVHNGSPDA